ncbi:MAG: sigma-54-dependent transcriptional regulator [Myxococcaceae bacterium]
MREYLEVLLSRAGHEVSAVGNVSEARARLTADPFDLVITDMRVGPDSGLEVLRTARALKRAPEVIVITAFGDPAGAVEAMRQGAYDYILKPFDNEEFKLLVQKALEKRVLLEENAELRRSLQPQGFGVGQSERMAKLWALIEKVAPTRSTVLITGESGTGKELVARAIHWRSDRAAQPFVPVNCAALAEGVLESELFGHVKGAFTGAASDRPGLLVSAGQGTVFLDEIGEIAPSIQVRLLRVLQEKQVKPVGSSQEVPFHARMLAATNRNLEAEVKAGRFREDLFYRLNVISLELPPLRERSGDIPLLANHFLAQVAQELARPKLRFAPTTLELLSAYRFPGNVRQLQNIVERAATLADKDILDPETLPPALRGESDTGSAAPEVPMGEGFSLERWLDERERAFLQTALSRAGGVRVRAAQLLGLSFRSFRYRLAKHGLGDVGEGEPRE